MKKITKILLVAVLALSLSGTASAMTRQQALERIDFLTKILIELQAKLTALQAIEAQNKAKNPYVAFYVNDSIVEETDGIAFKVGKPGPNYLDIYLKDAKLEKTTCSLEMTDKKVIVLKPKTFKVASITVPRGFTMVNISCLDDEGRNAVGKFRASIM